MTAVHELDATALRNSILKGERSVRDTIQDTFARIDAVDPALHVFLNTQRNSAMARATELDQSLAQGERPGALFGVPVALKANMCLAGVETNCGSKILKGYRPPYTATFVQRLIDAGAIVVGMTNMDEFAMGSSCENSALGVTHNPYDLSRVPGPSVPRHLLAYFERFDAGWYGITNTALGLGVGLVWPKELFPYAWFWQELNFSADFPWFGRARVIAIEPASTQTSGPDRRSVLVLDAEQSTTITTTLTVSRSGASADRR